MTLPGVIVLALLAAIDPMEIQVYQGEINDPGQAGIELHTNYVGRGRSTAAFAGELVPDRRLHMTLEPSFGLSRWWELGVYLQMAAAPGRLDAAFGGLKLRSKIVAPRVRTAPFVVGVNVEVGRGTKALGTDGWDTELRPIFACKIDRWFFVANPMVGWALSGDTHPLPEFEPAAKIRFDTRRGFAVGLEYYAGLGRVGDFLPISEQEHIAYVAGDLIGGPIALNAGFGRGLTGATADWIAKLILGWGF